jgi:hypothetical protein
MAKTIETRKYLAELFGWDKETLTRKLRAIGITHRGLLTPMDLQLIYNKIGTPEQRKKLAEMFRQ